MNRGKTPTPTPKVKAEPTSPAAANVTEQVPKKAVSEVQAKIDAINATESKKAADKLADEKRIAGMKNDAKTVNTESAAANPAHGLKGHIHHDKGHGEKDHVHDDSHDGVHTHGLSPAAAS